MMPASAASKGPRKDVSSHGCTTTVLPAETSLARAKSRSYLEGGEAANEPIAEMTSMSLSFFGKHDHLIVVEPTDYPCSARLSGADAFHGDGERGSQMRPSPYRRAARPVPISSCPRKRPRSVRSHLSNEVKRLGAGLLVWGQHRRNRRKGGLFGVL
jgi:hypothetical protein